MDFKLEKKRLKVGYKTDHHNSSGSGIAAGYAQQASHMNSMNSMMGGIPTSNNAHLFSSQQQQQHNLISAIANANANNAHLLNNPFNTHK